jgi:hypothetical protein
LTSLSWRYHINRFYWLLHAKTHAQAQVFSSRCPRPFSAPKRAKRAARDDGSLTSSGALARENASKCFVLSTLRIAATRAHNREVTQGYHFGAEMLTSAAIVDRPLRTRSAVSNGSRMHPKGVDGRSTQARRFKDLVASFAASLGGDASLNEGVDPQRCGVYSSMRAASGGGCRPESLRA